MTRILFIVTLVVFSLSACKKDSSAILTPEASFTFNGDTSRSLTIGTYDQSSLINKSTNADSFIWDLGNGTTSKDKEIVLTYTKSGTYTLTLTAIKEG